MPPKRFYRKTTAANTQKTKTPGKFVKAGVWLVIVESPSKCKKIEEYLGDTYHCIASKGHIRAIDGLKSIDIDNGFAPTFSLIAEKKDHVETMTAIIRQFPPENVLIATDDDREGEAIAWHICEVFGLPIHTTKRILFHEITKDAIRSAVATPTTVNMPLVYAQHARQVLDMVVGYTISPLLWKHIYNDKTNGLSAGRCQTPALRLIYENHVEYKARVLQTEYHTAGYFFEKAVKFSLNRRYTTPEEIESFLSKSKMFEHRLAMGAPKESTKSPPIPFTTSRLLQTASSTLHYSPKQTMDLCQQLYQSGLITYMRTDSSKYSPVFLEQAAAFLRGQCGDAADKYIGDFSKIENRDVANPHEAIRVSNIGLSTISDANRCLVSMYRLIWKNTVESCMSSATYLVRQATITSPDPEAQYTHTLEIPVFLGWRRASSFLNETGAEKEAETVEQQTGMALYFESMENRPVALNYVESQVHAESRHSHYTEASLIQRLESLGIGRPSTYASIVDTIQDRGYVQQKDIAGLPIKCREYKLARRTGNIDMVETERIFGAEKRKLVIQPSGIIVLEFLVRHFDALFSYDYTQQMESRLDEVAVSQEARDSWSAICREWYDRIQTPKTILSKTKRETYPIGDGAELVFHSTGASVKQTQTDGTVVYRSVRKNADIDLGMLKRGEYTVDELLEIPEEQLGIHEDKPVLLKSGPYGLYVDYGGIKISLKTLSKPAYEITLADVVPFLAPSTIEATLDLVKIKDTYSGENTKSTLSSGKTAIRELTTEFSVRNGKYGAYVFYQKSGVKKPTFLNIKKFKENVWTCDQERLMEWLRETYRI